MLCIRKSNIFRLLKFVISTVSEVVKICMPLLIPQTIRYFTDTVVIYDAMTVRQKTNEIHKWLIILLFIYIVIYISLRCAV